MAHNHAHHLSAVCIEHLEMVKLTLRDGNEIQVYSIDMRKMKVL